MIEARDFSEQIKMKMENEHNLFFSADFHRFFLKG